MGQISSKVSAGMKATMDEQFRKQSEFQMENFRLQLERQLAMQNEMRERQVSMQIGRARQIFTYYYAPFYALVLAGGVLGAMARKSPGPLIPSVPLGFIFAYQYDAAYGNLMLRARDEAEKIMAEERDRIAVPHGMPTFELIEEKRLAKKSK